MKHTPQSNDVLKNLVERIKKCDTCNGTGKDSPGDACHVCGGQGRVLDATALISEIEDALTDNKQCHLELVNACKDAASWMFGTNIYNPNKETPTLMDTERKLRKAIAKAEAK